jgi:hypothetical protein
LTSCDPVHHLKLENKTQKPIEVIYNSSGLEPTNEKAEKININGHIYAREVLHCGQKMEIGTVVARYVPKPHDVSLDYLEIHIGNDTMKLIGKKAIFTAIHKVGKLDWRFVVRDEW